MQDARSVITHATAKHVGELAQEMEVGLSRMYEILGKDNPYPKCKRLIRKIAKVNLAGVRPIKADMMALFDELLRDDDRDVTAAELHKEAFEAVDAMLSGKSADEQIQELRELVAIAQLKISGIEKLKTRGNLAPVA
jgi:uncharacterized protein with ATP-grasp and redox domains